MGFVIYTYILTDGERMAYVGLPFTDTYFPLPDVYILYVSNMINVWNTISTFIHLPWLFLSTDILFF